MYRKPINSFEKVFHEASMVHSMMIFQIYFKIMNRVALQKQIDKKTKDSLLFSKNTTSK